MVSPDVFVVVHHRAPLPVNLAFLVVESKCVPPCDCDVSCCQGEHADASELSRLLQLVLGCAVHCENKHGMKSVQQTISWLRCVWELCVCLEYIQTIMQLEESVQHAVMGAIQEVCSAGYWVACSTSWLFAMSVKERVGSWLGMVLVRCKHGLLWL